MPLLINDKHNSDHEIRILIVNDVEKYRLMADNTLIYAKGWINFDINLPKDGSGNLISYNYEYNTNRNGVYAFYEDGFYSKDANDSWEFKGSYLLSINNLTSVAADFKGWYTERDGGKQVNSIKEIFEKTDLFNYNKNTSIPQVTLYAKWEVHKYTVYVDNITRYANGREGRSSIWYDGRKRFGTIELRDILYNTEIISYLNARMSNAIFISGARNMLDRTPQQQPLREGVQSFIGWHTTNNARGNTLSNYRITEDGVHIYPQFMALVIWPRVYFPRVTVNGVNYWDGESASGYAVISPEFTKGQAIYKWENEFGFPAWNDIPDPWSGSRNYDGAGFPLGSADTAIVYLNYYV